MACHVTISRLTCHMLPCYAWLVACYHVMFELVIVLIYHKLACYNWFYKMLVCHVLACHVLACHVRVVTCIACMCKQVIFGLSHFTLSRVDGMF